jgi:hypothetical protein
MRVTPDSGRLGHCIRLGLLQKDPMLTQLLTLQRPLHQIMKRETLYLHCRPIYRGIFLAIKYMASWKMTCPTQYLASYVVLSKAQRMPTFRALFSSFLFKNDK